MLKDLSKIFNQGVDILYVSTFLYYYYTRLPTYRAVDVAITSFGTQTLLAITHYEQSVSVYRFALDLGFLLLEEVHISHCQSAVFGEVKGDEYLVVTTDSSVDPTQILKLKPIGKDRCLYYFHVYNQQFRITLIKWFNKLI